MDQTEKLQNEQIVLTHQHNKQVQEAIGGPEEAQDVIDKLKARKPSRDIEDKPLKKKRKLLSFEVDQDDQTVTAKIRKNINPKNDGLREINKSDNLEEQLRDQYFREMDRIKEELVELQYSYWDGPNVIKKIRRKKKETVKEILEVCRLELIENFQNVASIEAREFLFVIKDFIAPHEMSLGNIQILKLKTAKDDLLLNLRNVKIKKDGKELTLSVNLDGPVRIIERSRFEKSKASYPFCNWHTLIL